MKYIYNNIYVSMLALCVAALGLFMALTNPANIGVGWLIVPIALIFLIVFCASHLLMEGLKLFADDTRRKRTVALGSASLLAIIVILQSTGGISGADMLLLGLTIVVAGLYISKY